MYAFALPADVALPSSFMISPQSTLLNFSE
jgi:hypothetical protein